MYRILRNVLTFTCLLIASTTGPARPQKATGQEIQQAFERYRQAFLRKDMNAITALLTPDFTWKMADGTTLDRAGTTHTLREQMTTIRAIEHMDIQIHRMQLQKDRAIAIITETTRARIAGPGGKTETATSRERYRVTWVRTAARWRIQKTEAL
ncbi:MAG: nuclear transport factor 2 family protein [Chloroherpetonaceae bacterium]|nr:nuclear transport factor 2 family protein [Chthonomonadaceae bacterium]MDW8209283.1 nuclear transport factor 2 family protein [Chloroherpetonaceae bacterium]